MKYTPVAATFSKDPGMWGYEFKPVSIERGFGARVQDTSGNSYIDWVCGLGANLLGHGDPGFVQHVSSAIDLGLSFSLPSYKEEEVAGLICEKIGARIFDTSLQVRFGATGTDACAAAIRLARAVSGKFHILSFGYHGWGAEFVCMTPPAWGIIPDESGYIHNIEWNKPESLPERDDVAAIIVEQGVEEPSPGWYQELRDWCDKHQALLIIDEVVTGIRFGFGGACQRYHIEPDIVVLGKALGNGLPISCVLAPAEYMSWFARNDPVFALSSTTNANPACLAAAEYVLNNWSNKKAADAAEVASWLKRALIENGYDVIGQNERYIIRWKSDLEHAFFVEQMSRAGILANRPFFCTPAHTMEMVTHTAWTSLMIREKLDSGEAHVEGYPRVLFRGR